MDFLVQGVDCFLEIVDHISVLLFHKFIVDHTDIVEAAGDEQIHEFDGDTFIKIEEMFALDHFDDVLVDEFCLQTLQVGGFDPFIKSVISVDYLFFLEVCFDLC